jgi:acyl-coenzyme A thioesterase PaaI-like protein
MKTGAAILDKVLQGAISRQEYRRLNWLLTRAVPFNRPHGLRITALSQTVAQVEMPYKRRNYNHLKGMHAAAICALGEFPAGLLLLANLPARKYRLILAKLEAEYHLQGRSDLHAQVSWPV